MEGAGAGGALWEAAQREQRARGTGSVFLKINWQFLGRGGGGDRRRRTAELEKRQAPARRFTRAFPLEGAQALRKTAHAERWALNPSRHVDCFQKQKLSVIVGFRNFCFAPFVSLWPSMAADGSYRLSHSLASIFFFFFFFFRQSTLTPPNGLSFVADYGFPSPYFFTVHISYYIRSVVVPFNTLHWH